MRTRTSPTAAGTVIHFSSTSSLAIGAAWTSSRTFRAPSAPSSYKNGGFDVASANRCAAASRTCLLMGESLPFGVHWMRAANDPTGPSPAFSKSCAPDLGVLRDGRCGAARFRPNRPHRPPACDVCVREFRDAWPICAGRACCFGTRARDALCARVGRKAGHVQAQGSRSPGGGRQRHDWMNEPAPVYRSPPDGGVLEGCKAAGGRSADVHVIAHWQG